MRSGAASREIGKMEQLTLSALSREQAKTRANKRLRRTGRVPAVIYGGHGEPELISVDSHEIEMILGGATKTTKVFSLDCDGKLTSSIIRVMQRHPVTSKIGHIDFQRINIDEEITIKVPVHFEGTPAGVRNGGVLEFSAREVEVRCLPLSVPHHISFDAKGVEVNETVHVRDLTAPEGVAIVSDPDDAIASVLPPKGEAEAGSEELDQPEVIGEKKTEE